MRPVHSSPPFYPDQSPLSTSVPHSPWHSPVPYLFGGLAAMLGLIALALLILACSYWKLNSLLSESGEPPAGDDAKPVGPTSPVNFREFFAVFMPGEEKPTFIATPSCSREVSFDVEKLGEEKEKESPV